MNLRDKHLAIHPALILKRALLTLLCTSLLTAFTVESKAKVTLAPAFRDSAILQRNQPINVWGLAEPGESVTVEFAGKRFKTKANSEGKWIGKLPALPANNKPREMKVSGQNTIAIRDILVGEVWLCSGQSNMEWPIKDAGNPEAEIALANYPTIREFQIPRRISLTPEFDTPGEWKAATPETVAEFSAVAYQFARILQKELNVPVGIINATYGGSAIEPWMSSESLDTDPELAWVNESWSKRAKAFPKIEAKYAADLAAWETQFAEAKSRGDESRQAFLKDNRKPTLPYYHSKSKATPSGLFNGMLNPVLPYSIRGALWYQGESNAKRRQEAYGDLFVAMISDWRSHLGQEDMPFLWVQLANFNSGRAEDREWALVRESQDKALDLPATGTAITIDIGEPDNIHPKDKQEVARRLAQNALAIAYGRKTFHRSPRFHSSKTEGANLRIQLTNTEGGLVARGGTPLALELAGEDGIFFPASANVDGDELVAYSPDIDKPIHVRYAFSDSPNANLFNAVGLPVSPFRSDNMSVNWIRPFHAEFNGWTKRGGEAAYEVVDKIIVGTNGPGPNTFLCTDEEYSDFELEFDVKLSKRLNSGVQIRSKSRPKSIDGQTIDRVYGPQVEIEASPGESGYIYGEDIGGWITPEEDLIRHSHFNNEEWNHYRIVSQGPRIRTWINGQQISDLTLSDEVYQNHSSGFIGFQVHKTKDPDGTLKAEWQNIRIRPIE